MQHNIRLIKVDNCNSARVCRKTVRRAN